MDRKGAWITVGILAGAVALFALSNLLAYRAPIRPSDTVSVPEATGRFQVVRSAADHIILLDSATGDLWKARIPEDVRPYKERVRPEPVDRGGPTDKDKDKPADIKKDIADAAKPFRDKAKEK